MQPVGTPRNRSRRRLALGLWSILAVSIALTPPGLPFGLSIVIMVFVSVFSATAMFLLRGSAVETEPKDHAGSWSQYVPVIVSLLIPLAWSLFLCEGRPPLSAGVLFLIACGPVCVTWPSFEWIRVGRFENLNESEASRAFAKESEFTDVCEQTVERKESAARFKHIVEQAADERRDEILETATPDVTQWLTRTQTADGEIIEGGVRIEFVDGQREATIHLSFCPPFSTTPHIVTEDLDAANLEIHVASSFPFGVRLSVRRSGLVPVDENGTSTYSCRVGFVAIATRLLRAG